MSATQDIRSFFIIEGKIGKTTKSEIKKEVLRKHEWKNMCGQSFFTCQYPLCEKQVSYRFAKTGPVPFHCIDCCKTHFQEKYKIWQEKMDEIKEQEI